LAHLGAPELHRALVVRSDGACCIASEARAGKKLQGRTLWRREGDGQHEICSAKQIPGRDDKGYRLHQKPGGIAKEEE
jgi:hypothetical protein